MRGQGIETARLGCREFADNSRAKVITARHERRGATMNLLIIILKILKKLLYPEARLRRRVVPESLPTLHPRARSLHGFILPYSGGVNPGI